MLTEQETGIKTADVRREHGISEAAFCARDRPQTTTSGHAIRRSGRVARPKDAIENARSPLNSKLPSAGMAVRGPHNACEMEFSLRN